jgi:hypothetical protein
MTDAVAQPTEEYMQMSQFWQLTRSLRGGTPEMRAAGKLYLPQEPDESPAAYENRLKRTVLTNLYKKSADKLVGKPLKKPVVVQEDVPPEISSLLDDVDSLGTRLDVFAKNILQQAIDDGLTHILVEFPNTLDADDGEFVNPDGSRSLSVAQARERNVRPFARHIHAADLIGWKWDVINGEKTLTQIRIQEYAKVDVDEFNQETRHRVRVYEQDSWRLYEKHQRKDKNGQTKEEWLIIDAGANTLGYIPLVTLYTRQIGFMMGRPWLEDIAHLNVAHWQSDSDQRNLLHVARVPILFAKGFGNDETEFEISIGSNTFIKAPASADLKYVEHSGKGVESGRNDLKDIEERIQMLGMETMMKKPSGSTTATEKAIDTADADSSLGMVSQELENALEEMLDVMADWLEMGDKGGGSLTVFKDFSIDAATSEDIELLLKARSGGEISRTTFLRELKRRNLLSDDFDPQTEIDLLDIEAGGSMNVIPEPDVDPLTGEETGEDKDEPGRNKAGDMTSMDDGHRHILEEGGMTSMEVGDDGIAHRHEWDEFSINTSVDEGHSHTLLTRAAATKSEAPPGLMPPGAPAVPPGSGGNNPPPGDNDDDQE